VRAYQGCYADRGERAFPYLLNTNSFSIDACLSASQAIGMPYAALQNGGQCWGGRDLRYEKLPESSCNMPCSDQRSEMCGGPLINSAFSTGAVIQPMPQPQPPENRLACDLGGGPTGTWQNITPVVLQARPNMESTFATVDLHRPGVLYSSASNRTAGGNGDGSYTSAGLQMSSDCGKTWQAANQTAGVNYRSTKSGMIWSLQSGRQSDVLYLVVGYGEGGLMRSTDAGANWVTLFPVDSPVQKIFDPSAPLFVNSVAIDPDDDKHLLVTFHNSCYGPTQRNTHNCLAESEDGGLTWRTFYAARPETGWREAQSAFMIDRTRWIFFGKGAHYTADSGRTWTEIASGEFYGGTGIVISDAVLISGDGTVRVSRATPAAPAGAPGSWTVLQNAPNANAFVSDGVNLYASSGDDTSGHPFRKAPLSDLTQWSTMPSPTVGRGAGTLNYDAKNKVLYAATSVVTGAGIVPGGVWRFVIR
jgi:hypothetical protein